MHLDDTLLERIAEKRLVRFARLLAEEFGSLYPKRCRIVGKNNLHLFCHGCCKDAYILGATNYGELKSYAFVAWHLGVGFARDPYYRQIQTIFASEDDFDEKMQKISALMFEAYFLHDKHEVESYTKALQRILTLNLKKLTSLQNYMQIAQVLENIYPQRVKAMGGVEHISTVLVSICKEHIVRYNINHPLGIFIYSALTFFLGSNVANDPLYGWVGKYLQSTELKMASKIDILIKVIQKRARNEKRSLEKILRDKDHG